MNAIQVHIKVQENHISKSIGSLKKKLEPMKYLKPIKTNDRIKQIIVMIKPLLNRKYPVLKKFLPYKIPNPRPKPDTSNNFPTPGIIGLKIMECITKKIKNKTPEIKKPLLNLSEIKILFTTENPKIPDVHAQTKAL